MTPRQDASLLAYGLNIFTRLDLSSLEKLAGSSLNPHDLRRHAATFASRAGTPLEIVSKLILRYVHLSTTQPYLGKVSEPEAVRWIENLYK